MLQLFLFGLGFLCATVIIVGFLSISTIKDKLRKDDMVKASIRKIVSSGSVVHVTMDAFDEYGNHKEIEYEADEIDSEIRRGKVIYA